MVRSSEGNAIGSIKEMIETISGTCKENGLNDLESPYVWAAKTLVSLLLIQNKEIEEAIANLEWVVSERKKYFAEYPNHIGTESALKYLAQVTAQSGQYKKAE